jgi:imidazole glycerol-phosphate synthase subunit HisF
MSYKRVIPVLLIQEGGLVKGKKFANHKYVGDPINAVRIFNEKEVDEICILDISATASNRGPDLMQIQEIASEAFMPLSYGGGITSVDQVKQIINAGVEKVVFNSTIFNNLSLVTETAKVVGSSSTVVSVDVKKNLFGKYRVYIENGKRDTGKNPAEYVKELESAGAGEIIINSIDKDGTQDGLDTQLIKNVAQAITIPLIACGGAGNIGHIKSALDSGADAVAAGAMFVFYGKHDAVLISYLSALELQSIM